MRIPKEERDQYMPIEIISIESQGKMIHSFKELLECWESKTLEDAQAVIGMYTCNSYPIYLRKFAQGVAIGSGGVREHTLNYPFLFEDLEAVIRHVDIDADSLWWEKRLGG